MTRAQRALVVDDDGLRSLLEPRSFPVQEAAARGEDGAVRFAGEKGPFHHYLRRVEHEPEPDGKHRVVHTVDYNIAIPLWAPLYRPLVNRAALAVRPARRAPWWAPPVLIDPMASSLLAVACVLALVTGWSQAALASALPLIRIDFDVTTGAMAGVMAARRIAGLVGLGGVFLVDRVDRGKAAGWLAVAAVGTTVVSGLAPTLGTLAAAQVLASMITAASVGLLPVLVVDALPAGARAYGAQVLILTGGIGAAGASLGFLLGDITPRAWRLSFLGAIVLVVPLALAARHLAVLTAARHASSEAAPTAEGDRSTPAWRLGALMFLNALFATPAVALLADYLRNTRGMSSGEVTVFFAVMTLPVAPAFLVAGRLAARVDHRALLAAGLVGGGVALLTIYLVEGPAMWLAAAVSSSLFGLAAPTATIFGPASVSAQHRGRANAMLNGLGIAGGAVGLWFTAAVSDSHSVATGLVILCAVTALFGLPLLRSVTPNHEPGRG